MFIAFFAGEGRQNKTLALAICVTSDVQSSLSTVSQTSPFELRVLGVEPGGNDKLRELQDKFAPFFMRTIWYRPAEPMLQYIAALPPVEIEKATKRVSLDLEPEDFADLETFVTEVGAKTKANLLRRAYRFYRRVHGYVKQGYEFQAIKGGKLVIFPNLDDIR